MYHKYAVLLALLLLFAVPSVSAQGVETTKNEVTIGGGFGPSLPGFPGLPSRLGLAEVQYARTFMSRSSIELKYTVEFVPLLLLNYKDTNPGSAALTYRTKYAAGVAPAGIKMQFRPKKDVKPFFKIVGGMLGFPDQVPRVGGMKLNFSIYAGLGIDYRLKDKRDLSFGWRYYHISNASRGAVNPGFNPHVFSVGYKFSF